MNVSGKTDARRTMTKARKDDALELANLVYDIFKKRKEDVVKERQKASANRNSDS